MQISLSTQLLFHSDAYSCGGHMNILIFSEKPSSYNTLPPHPPTPRHWPGWMLSMSCFTHNSHSNKGEEEKTEYCTITLSAQNTKRDTQI